MHLSKLITKEIINTEYGNIAAYKKGSGKKTLLLLHGAGCDSTMLSWKEVFDILTDDFSVYAFDFLGYGHSDRADQLVGERFYDTHIACVKVSLRTTTLLILLWPDYRWAALLPLVMPCAIRKK